ncbi:hypothetical protein BZG02_09195 [Labilibaculum filiforme]|uniref:DUF4175 domain-containing protein n=1 Tax=Labilibaculum filiforme TaxID=1940526 RepID=A0A2N3HZU5_9BACT|nr:DUF4175 family protein [Labilibaculum filiforme]PKQ63537.1 hypothetical protein BZG02_09195 [Labilibaculum filiforme]
MGSSQEIFINKLDRFIRKYYQNQLLRGILLSVVLILAYFLIVTYTEYLLYFSVSIRTFLAVFSILLVLLVTGKLIILPIIGLLQIGSRISYRQAINIITQYFPDLQDRLINTLELTELTTKSDAHNDSLLMASINQRMESIQLIPFRQAISFKSNLSYLKYFFLVFVAIVGTYIALPDMYSSSANRLVHFRQEYNPPADFKFVIAQQSMKVVRGSDFELEVHTEGKYVPAEVYLITEGNQFLLKKKGSNGFTYLFRNINKEINFYLQAGKINSLTYKLELLLKPGIKTFELAVVAPPYTKLPVRKEQNLGDISVPEGAKLTWKIEGEDTNSVQLVFNDTLNQINEQNEGKTFIFSKTIKQKNAYQIYVGNEQFEKQLFANYSIDVIPDLYPQISVSTIQDSLVRTAYYFKGVLKDDYGFSNLRFCYLINDQLPVYIPINISKNLSVQEFYYAFDFATVEVNEGSQVQYYFEVFDNDGVNKPKMTSSQQFSLLIPDSKQLYDLNTSIQDSISNRIEKGIDLSQSIQEDIKRLQKNLLDGTGDKWQQQQIFQQIDSKKKQLEDLLNNIKQENQKKNPLLNSSNPKDSLLMEKQKQIEKLLENVMDDELQKLFEEFNKLAEDFKSEDLNKLGNQTNMSFDDFQKQMNRNLSLLERYDIEVNMNKIIDRIDKIADDQEEISTLGRKQEEKMNSQQVEESKKWEDLKKDLENLLEKNSGISDPYQFQNPSDDLQSISEMMNESNNLLENGKNSKAANNMKATSKKQKALAQKLNSNLSKSIGAQLSVDIDNLIRLMYNLMEFSFQQESILNDYKMVDYRNPLFVKMIEQQGGLKEEYLLIQDSLLALSSHSPQVAALIGNRIFDISNYLDQVLDEANNRRKIQANITQQKVLTEVNELALFLSEALKQLMEQMANAMPGDQMGDKKGGKPSFSGMQSEQQSLKKMLEEMIQEMKAGNGKNSSKEKLGQFLQRQEMFQQNLKEMIQQGGVGDETEQILREIMKMIDQTELDITNFSLNSNTLNRQNRILSRLLEAENAHREKDFEKKRESNSGNIIKLSNPTEIFEYKRIRTDFEGVFDDSYVKMLDYYNKLYLDYMIKINND